MGVVDDLEQARTDFERGDWAAALDIWSGVDRVSMSSGDLHEAGVATYLLGRRDVAVDYEQRAFAACQEGGDPVGAIRCCFYLARLLGISGEAALAQGWTARAERLLEDLPGGAVEAGYVSILQMHGQLATGDLAAASRSAVHAAAVGSKHGDPDLLALGLCSQGRLTIYSGRIADGLRLLDEAMAGVAAGEVTPVVFGDVYCTAIEGCQEIGDVGRVGEWTSALHHWCRTHPGLVAFTGQRSLHRGQLMRAHGAWPEALEEFGSAIERYRLADLVVAVGLAECERGDVLRLRGELAAAETAYQRSSEHGYDPQPGLALLWLARGADDAAAAAIRRLVTETSDLVPQCRLLPAAVHVLVAVGALEEAHAVAAQLDEVAAAVGTETLLACTAFASGSVELASGDAAGALPYLRKARLLWAHARMPYEGAQVSLLTARALIAVGDEQSARRELEAACAAFRRLGAIPAAEEAEQLLQPTDYPAGLTGREVEVLRLVASGRSNAQIAAELVLSQKTVARHLSNVFTKLDVESRTAAAAYAFEHGLV